MASAAHSSVGMVLPTAGLLTPGTAFTASAPTAQVATPPALRSSAAASAAAAEQNHGSAAQAGRLGATAGVASAVCALAVAAGAKRLMRRRPGTQRNVLDKPTQVIEWQVDPKTPAPGSEKALAAMVGADVETDGVWDPLGFGKLYDRNFDFNMVMTYPHVQWLREAEIKHGRVAMMAATGSVVAHYVKMPGFEGVPTGLAALGTNAGATGFAVLLLLAGVLEAARGTRPADQPGSYGDPFGFGEYTEEMRAKELNNGRFAMFAALGIVAADLLTGKDAIQQLGL
uniref:Uncharacterized protein n=1 Tax=Pyrodinium bahamense TaxID=73915 RepID=A0A7S0B535_9DINO|mmetsp:Transcript_50215/g.139457  ORF Transcript_50215/g.139457 Transcript_50215/m.139457 type:complete len:285 (+) Transcript_50215:88-942(+)